jgi:alpha-D-ribose 1-methylphosphonate 5-triphosphate synthase subunit PhnH
MLRENLAEDLAAGVLLALLDPGLRLAVAGTDDTRRLAESICAMTGAMLSPVEEAAFVLVTDGVSERVASRAFRGTPLQPERGATVIYAGSWPSVPVTLKSPGRTREEMLTLPMPVAELDDFARVNVDGPTGVDALIVDGPSLRGLPRGVVITRTKQVA